MPDTDIGERVSSTSRPATDSRCTPAVRAPARRATSPISLVDALAEATRLRASSYQERVTS